ncbi:MAG: potassium transporter TrkG, partial [Methanosphaera sp.]|nr:potassium transporter TrkG [Methanosphaera sp.]
MNIFSINKIKPAELKTIGHYTGYVSMVLGLLMIIPITCAYIYHDADIYMLSFTISAIINISIGLLLYFVFNTKSITNLSLKGSLIFVMSIWGFASLFASLPYFISGDLSFIDAFFEGMSGITTTGFSMYDVYTFPYSISMWRCLIQWFGGLGIIFLLLVIVPSSVSLKRLYFAEGKTEQMTPNIKHTATIFIKVYLILTVLAVSLYILAGLDPFDSICYSFVGIATGGYSIHPEHINNFTNPIIQLITMVVMLMGATNFIVH